MNYAFQVTAQNSVFDALEGTPYYHGMLAFAMEQVEDLVGAELHGRRGTEVQPDDPWSHHAVAHALYGQVRLKSIVLPRGTSP